MRFIAKCRRETTPYKLEHLVEWATRQDVGQDVEKQKAVCWYIIEGEYGEELADRLKSVRKPKWLFDVDVQHLKKWGWTRKKIDLFRNVRMVTEIERDDRVEEQLKTEGRSQLSLEGALDNIYEWWRNDGKKHLKDYEKELYPGRSF